MPSWGGFSRGGDGRRPRSAEEKKKRGKKRKGDGSHEKIDGREDSRLPHAGMGGGDVRQGGKAQRDDRGVGRDLLLPASLRGRFPAEGHLYLRQSDGAQGGHGERPIRGKLSRGGLHRHRLREKRGQVRRHGASPREERP